MMEKKENNELHNVAVYGSLREGMYNRAHFKSLTTNKEVRISGYRMYSLGAYPFVIQSNDQEDSVLFELCSCDEYDYNHIRRMELGAGYSEEVISTPEGSWLVYLYPENRRYSDFVHVGEGDWVKHKM